MTLAIKQIIDTFEELLKGYINLAADFGINARYWPKVKKARKVIKKLKEQKAGRRGLFE